MVLECRSSMRRSLTISPSHHHLLIGQFNSHIFFSLQQLNPKRTPQRTPIAFLRLAEDLNLSLDASKQKAKQSKSWPEPKLPSRKPKPRGCIFFDILLVVLTLKGLIPGHMDAKRLWTSYSNQETGSSCSVFLSNGFQNTRAPQRNTFGNKAQLHQCRESALSKTDFSFSD